MTITKTLLFPALLFIVWALLGVGAVAQAYETTNQSAFTVDGHLGVFLIQYSFGHGSYSLHMPLISEHTALKKNEVLSYEIYDDSEGEPAKGTATAIILSPAKVTDGEYVVPKGFKLPFTFLVFFTPSEDNLGDTYRLQVKHLPFSFNGTQNQMLNQSELERYTTEPLTLTP